MNVSFCVMIKYRSFFRKTKHEFYPFSMSGSISKHFIPIQDSTNSLLRFGGSSAPRFFTVDIEHFRNVTTSGSGTPPLRCWRSWITIPMVYQTTNNFHDIYIYRSIRIYDVVEETTARNVSQTTSQG